MRGAKYALTLLVVILAYFFLAEQDADRPAETAPVAGAARSYSSVDEAFQNGASDVVLEFSGDVARLLPDDRDGSRHQRFIVETQSGLTVLVAHNFDLAPRIDDIAIGQPITVKGEYEWNAQGGVIHWTHRDPQGRHEGGWIQYKGQRYE